MGGLKTFIPSKKLLVFFLGGSIKLKLANFCYIFNTPSRVIDVSPFLYPPKLLVCVFGGGVYKTETGKFLLHFQNSKSSNRCRSIYGTDKITVLTYFALTNLTSVNRNIGISSFLNVAPRCPKSNKYGISFCTPNLTKLTPTPINTVANQSAMYYRTAIYKVQNTTCYTQSSKIAASINF